MGSVSLNTVYYGPFVHCKELGTIDDCQKGAIGVDAEGKIAFVDRDVYDVEAVKKAHGWESAAVVKIPGDGFFFPGFIGLFSSNRIMGNSNLIFVQIPIFTLLNIQMQAFLANRPSWIGSTPIHFRWNHLSKIWTALHMCTIV